MYSVAKMMAATSARTIFCLYRSHAEASAAHPEQKNTMRHCTAELVKCQSAGQRVENAPRKLSVEPRTGPSESSASKAMITGWRDEADEFLSMRPNA